MANGADTDGYVVLSRIRPGLKREFAFALKSQAEYAGSIGRTRTRRSLSNGALGKEVSKHPNNKRLKHSNLESLKKGSEKHTDEDQLVTGTETSMTELVVKSELTNGVIGDNGERVTSVSEDEPKSDVVDLTSDDEPKSLLVESVVNDGELKDDLVEPMCIEVPEVEDQAKECNLDKPVVDSAAKKDEPDLLYEGGQAVEAKISALKLNTQPGDEIVEKALYEKPVKRVTRSAVKVMSETLERSASEEVKTSEGAEADVMSKLEMKMSKKIGLKRFPTKLRELLETGLLEDLPVRYLRGSKTRGPSDTGLRGIIRGSGILCSCDMCGGTQVVTPNQFELHAGSGNKRPPEYIYLENGKPFEIY